MLAVARLSNQRAGEKPALVAIGAVLTDEGLFLEASHCTLKTRKRTVSFELYEDNILVKTVKAVWPGGNVCGNRQIYPSTTLEVLSVSDP